MSYNVLKGSVEFIGNTLGQIEDIVNTHSVQRIRGPKTFTNITASGDAVGLLVDGALDISADIRHVGDVTTKLHFPNPGQLTLNASSVTYLYADGAAGGGQKRLVLNPNGADVDFSLKDGSNNTHLLFDSAQKVFTFGNSAQPDDSVFVHVTGAVANASLLSVGNRKEPILAISGAAQKQDWKVKVDGLFTSTGNIQSGGIVTGSLGLRGEVLNIGNGLENLALAGEKKISAKVSSAGTHAGLSVDTGGIGLNIAGLTEEGSINTDSAQPDWVFLLDNDGASNYTNKKQKLSTILANTAKSSMTNSGVNSGGGLYSAFHTFAADGRTAQLSGLTTPSNKLLRIYGSAPTFTIEQAESPAIVNLTSSFTLLNDTTIASALNVTTTFQLGGTTILAAGTEINRLAGGATPDANGPWVGLSRWAKAILEVPGGGTLAADTAHGLSVDIPNNALIIGGIIDIITTFQSNGSDTATIAIHAQGANDIVSAIAIDHGTNPWDAGLKTVVPSRTAPIKTTASRTVTATTAASQALTAGKAIIWLEYVLSDGS